MCPPHEARFPPFGSCRSRLRLEFSHAQQVEGAATPGEDGLNPGKTAVTQLAQATPGLHPAEGLLHQLASALACLVSLPTGGAAIDGAVAALGRHVRGDGEVAGARHEARGVIALVRSYRHVPALAVPLAVKQGQGRLALRSAGGRGDGGVHDETVPVLHQDVSGIGQPGFFAPSLAGQAGLGVGGGRMGGIAAALAVEVHLGVAAAAGRGSSLLGVIPRLLLGPEALQGGGRLKKRAVAGEVLAGEEPAGLGLAAHMFKERLSHLGGEQPVPVLAEAGVIPHLLPEGQPHEPAKEQVVLDVLTETPLRGDAVEDADELGAQEVLRGDGDTAPLGIEAPKQRTHGGKRLIHHPAEGAQGMIGRYPIIERSQHHHALLPFLISPHHTPLDLDLQGKVYQFGVQKDSQGRR